MISFVFQDFIARDVDYSVFKTLLRCFRLSGYSLLANYRLTQYVASKFGSGGVFLFKWKLERICNKYNYTIDYKLQSGKGLCLPHNGPVVINNGAKIGEYCTIHPNVLIGGDRGKGAPTIGDYVFIGNGAKIIGKCRIGNWCFIAPGAVITKDVPNDSVVGCGLNNIISKNGRYHVKMYL